MSVGVAVKKWVIIEALKKKTYNEFFIRSFWCGDA